MTATDTDSFEYGYDQSGNRLYRDNLLRTRLGSVTYFRRPGSWTPATSTCWPAPAGFTI